VYIFNQRLVVKKGDQFFKLDLKLKNYSKMEIDIKNVQLNWERRRVYIQHLFIVWVLKCPIYPPWETIKPVLILL